LYNNKKGSQLALAAFFYVVNNPEYLFSTAIAYYIVRSAQQHLIAAKKIL
jgi:protein-S-isoprenylcysteine O-methyltransferase Ste14